MKRLIQTAMLLIAILAESAYAKPMEQANNRFSQPIPAIKNRVHTAGLLWLNMTNLGIIGNIGNSLSPFIEHCSGSPAKGAEMPGASGIEHLYGAGLWFGGYLDSAETSNGTVMSGPFVSTAYEGWAHASVSGSAQHPAMEFWPTGYSNTTPGDISTKNQIVETSNIPGRVNCMYDPVYSQTANAAEQFTTWFTDNNTDIAATGLDDFDRLAFNRSQHIPLGLEIKQTSYAWQGQFAQKFVIVDYTIYNTNETKNIYNLFAGFFFDNDIGKVNNSNDDMVGFKQNATIIDETTGQSKTVPINMLWAADNDGRDPLSDGTEPGVNTALNGSTSIFNLKILRSPNSKMKYSFNYYNAAGSGSIQNEDINDWGPRWKDGLHDMEYITDPQTGAPTYNSGWFGRYNVSYNQRGYSDGRAGDTWGIRQGLGGMTEGRPLGDYGRYMMMSNGEFDYDLIHLTNPDMASNNPNANIPVAIDPENCESINKQQHKYQPWLPADGPIDKMQNFGNGTDPKFVVSFGPLGNSINKQIATVNGSINKNVWKLAPHDSLKFTVAFIVSENFHRSPSQNPLSPDFSDSKVNWRDVSKNALWVDRIFDIPMYDSKVKSPVTGQTKGDGWYGEDIGADATFSIPDTTCWWNNLLYTGRDAGEHDFAITDFTSPAFDGSTNEDKFLKHGNTTTVNESIGLSTEHGAIGYYNAANSSELVRYGWNDNLLTAGDGVPDFKAPMAPKSPQFQTIVNGNTITIKWKYEMFVEDVPDRFSNLKDFEGYNIWLSSNLTSFTEIFSVDKVDFVYENANIPGQFICNPFLNSSNTAPEILQPGQSVEINGVTITNTTQQVCLKVPYGNNRLLTNHSVSNLAEYSAWQSEGVWNYQLVLNNLLNSKKYIAITASDFGDVIYGVPPQSGHPASNCYDFTSIDNTLDNKTWSLDQNYPNPFNNKTTIFFNAPDRFLKDVKLSIYNINGQRVKELFSGKPSAGKNTINADFSSLASGIYYYALESDNFFAVKRMVLVK